MKIVSPAQTFRFFRKVNLLIMICIGLLGGCSEPGIEKSELPAVLKVGILPDDRGPDAVQRHILLLDYLSEELGITYEIIVPKDYADTVKRFVSGELDLAYFGGLTFLQAHAANGAVPLVTRDIDLHYTSYLITRPGEIGFNPQQFKGRILSFGSRLSTSGHLMPRHVLNGLIGSPEEFFSKVLYSGSHDETVYNVRKGKADLGAVGREILENMYADGRISDSDISVWRESQTFPDYIWTAHPSLGETATIRLRDAFLSLTPSKERDAIVLAACNAGGFLPASMEDFATLYRVASDYGLLDAEQ